MNRQAKYLGIAALVMAGANHCLGLSKEPTQASYSDNMSFSLYGSDYTIRRDDQGNMLSIREMGNPSMCFYTGKNTDQCDSVNGTPLDSTDQTTMENYLLSKNKAKYTLSHAKWKSMNVQKEGK